MCDLSPSLNSDDIIKLNRKEKKKSGVQSQSTGRGRGRGQGRGRGRGQDKVARGGASANKFKQFRGRVGKNQYVGVSPLNRTQNQKVSE